MHCDTKQGGGERGWLVAALLLGAFLVRWLPALIPHFWYDEVYTVALIHHPFAQILKLTGGDAHPPLYYYWVKCFAAAGLRLGGPFATLAWLRQASILPGVLTCLLAWWVARRFWGRGAALWTLALFAVSPALTYYSDELRNYALAHCLLLAALIALLHVTDPLRPHRWRATLFFAGAVTAALYVHTLVSLYLGAFGLIFLLEWTLARTDQSKLFLLGATGLALSVLAFLPWLPTLLEQRDFINTQTQSWLLWARWRDLPATFFCALPLGPIVAVSEFARWAMGASGLFFFSLLGLLTLRRRSGLRSAAFQSPQSPSPPRFDRLLLYSAVLSVCPIMTAFFISNFHIARIFLGYRYNLLAAPFFNLLLLGLFFRIPRSWLRTSLFCALLTISALASVWTLWQKTITQNEFAPLGAREPALLEPGSRVYWTDSAVLPWLSRCGTLKLGSMEEALANTQTSGGPATCYFATCAPTGAFSGPGAGSTLVLENILERRKQPRINTKGLSMWSHVWRLRAADLGAVAAEYRAACQAIETRRNAIAGGQTLLADDPAFDRGRGWSDLELGAPTLLSRRTQGRRQRLEWSGPDKAGTYRLKMTFWRYQPFPEKVVLVRYRLPGQSAWQAQPASVGPLEIEAAIRTTRPGEKLCLELETPTWIPAERLPGSDDRRPLGINFVSLELRPEEGRRPTN